MLHEIGHNFGLLGDVGDDPFDSKLDYRSVMNYTFQFPRNSLDPHPDDPTRGQAGYIPDYSRDLYVSARDGERQLDGGSEWNQLRLDFASFGATFGNSYGAKGRGALAFDPNLMTEEVSAVIHPEDPQLPLLLIVAPARSDTVTVPAPLTVQVIATDNIGVASVRVFADLNGDGDTSDNGESVLAGLLDNDSYSADFDAVVGPSGPRIVEVYVTDSAGNVNRDDRSFLVAGGTTNAPPTARRDALTTSPGVPVTIDVLENDGDRNGDLIFVVAVTPADHGSVHLHANGSVLYTPANGYVGRDTFHYTISDSHGDSDSGTVTIDVQDVNLAPVLAVIDDQYVVPGATLRFIASASDANAGQTLTFVLAADTMQGPFLDPVTGEFTWQPGPEVSSGIHDLRIGVHDNGIPALFAWQTVRIMLQVETPRILTVWPNNGDEVPSLSEMRVTFSEAMDLSRATDKRYYQVLHETLGQLPISSVTYQDADGEHLAIIHLDPSVHVPPGAIHLRLDGRSLRSTRGQAMSDNAEDWLAIVGDGNIVARQPRHRGRIHRLGARGDETV